MTFFPASPQDGEEDIPVTDGHIGASGSFLCGQSAVAVWAFISQNELPYALPGGTLSPGGLTQAGSFVSLGNNTFAYSIGSVPGAVSNGQTNFLRLYAVDSSLTIVERGIFSFTGESG